MTTPVVTRVSQLSMADTWPTVTSRDAFVGALRTVGDAGPSVLPHVAQGALLLASGQEVTGQLRVVDIDDDERRVRFAFSGMARHSPWRASVHGSISLAAMPSATQCRLVVSAEPSDAGTSPTVAGALADAIATSIIARVPEPSVGASRGSGPARPRAKSGLWTLVVIAAFAFAFRAWRQRRRHRSTSRVVVPS